MVVHEDDLANLGERGRLRTMKVVVLYIEL